jgi:hypothetical protein
VRGISVRRGIGWFICSLGCFLASWSRVDAQFTRDDFRRANEATVRLSPSAFPNLPAEVSTELGRRGCTIPQPYGARGPAKNVISGAFISAGQTDWAVLCSRERRSVILVFRGGHSRQVDELAAQADSQYLQQVSGQAIGYSRLLAIAAPKTIRRHAAPGTQLPRAIDHDGIDDRFVEKASVAWYYSAEKWMRLTGAD